MAVEYSDEYKGLTKNTCIDNTNLLKLDILKMVYTARSHNSGNIKNIIGESQELYNFVYNKGEM